MKNSLRIVAGALLVVLSTSMALAAPPSGKGGGKSKGGRTTSSCQATQAAPTIGGTPPTQTIEGVAYSFRPTASDPNCDPLTFSINGKPAWANFDAATGRLSGTPPGGTAGLYPYIVISVSDGRSATLLPAFSISVAPNAVPVISGTPPTQVQDGQLYSFRPTASDPEGQTLRFGISNMPRWATFSSSTGQLSGTPARTDAGVVQNVTITVTDGLMTASLAPFNITVVSANAAPTISGTPSAGAQVGSGYSFRPTAADPNGDRLTFGISNRPAWATFDSTTGQLAGTPAAGDVGSYSSIVISVSDGELSASLAPFSITVAAPNSAPRISGTPPASVQVGNTYLFRPTASDPDGDTLRFSIANRPAWAVFDNATGQLSGAPAASDAGTFSSIVISVTDGKATTSLAAFAVTVQQVSTGSATLSWQPPTSRTDGSALTNLAGYRIHYGTSPGNFTQRVTISNAGITSAVIEGLAPGTWYFAATAYDTAGVESDFSNVGSKTIN